jgi:hypothetical protein
MTFCTGCGTNLDANSAFCTGCGKLTVAPVENDPSSTEFSSHAPHTPNPAHPASPAPYPPPPASAGNKVARALVAALAILVVAAMLQSWLTIHIDMSPRGGGSIAGDLIREVMEDALMGMGFNRQEITDMFSADLDYAMTMHELKNFTGFTGWFADFNHRMLMREDPSHAWHFGQIMAPLDTLSLAVTGIMIAQAVGFALLAIFLFLLLLESKAAGLVGQIASLIVFLTASAFAFAMFFANSQLDGMTNILTGPMMGMGRMGGPMMNLGISLAPSIWVWTTMGISGISFLLITIFKRAFK